MDQQTQYQSGTSASLVSNVASILTKYKRPTQLAGGVILGLSGLNFYLGVRKRQRTTQIMSQWTKDLTKEETDLVAKIFWALDSDRNMQLTPREFVKYTQAFLKKKGDENNLAFLTRMMASVQPRTQPAPDDVQLVLAVVDRAHGDGGLLLAAAYCCTRH